MVNEPSVFEPLKFYCIYFFKLETGSHVVVCMLNIYNINLAYDRQFNLENTKNKLFQCDLYNDHLNILFLHLNSVPNFSSDLLTNSSPDFTVETKVILVVLKFIKDRGRFKQEP